MRKFRHGDLILEEIEHIPAGAKPRGNNILAEGEASGHAHRYFGGDVLEMDGVVFARPSTSEPYIDHEEHARKDISVSFRVLIQREYDDKQEWRNVTD